MDEKRSIDAILFDYFYSHPEKGVDDILEIANTEYGKARREIIPVYKPRIIEGLGNISDEFNTKRSRVQRKTLKDESTNSYGFEN